MRLSELLPMPHELPQSEKLRLIQTRAIDLERDEGLPPIESGHSYPVWSPFDAFEAAETLRKLISEDAGRSDVNVLPRP